MHPVPDTFGSGTRLKPDARACARRWLDFHVYPHGDGSVRTDHVVRWWGLPVLQLHYRITRLQDQRAA
ncbi:MAG TPA: hypothetical protein VJO72_09600 [Candidatus Dormibacteraeota bacterium]|nr:hypothetical protein [Candidatus Dormibacteraeota bacterium]